MATIQQTDRPPLVGVNFQVSEELKLRIDAEVSRDLRLTLRDFCISAITEKLDREEKRRTGKPGAK